MKAVTFFWAAYLITLCSAVGIMLVSLVIRDWFTVGVCALLFAVSGVFALFVDRMYERYQRWQYTRWD